MSTLPVRPIPYPSEAIQGYVLRLCEQNGWESFPRLLSATDRNPYLRTAADSRACMDVLHTLTGHATVNNGGTFAPGNSGVFERQDDAAFTYFEIDKPRVCPECLREESWIRAEWTHLPYTHCTRHGTRLIDECPHCGHHLKWVVPLLSARCPHCGEPLKARNSDSKVPAYQQHFERLDVDAQVRFLKHISMAAQRALRPYDLLIDQGKRPPKNVDHWESVLSTAYSMLTDMKFLDGWAASCRTHRKALATLGMSAVYAPITELAASVSSEWPIASWLPSSEAETGNARHLDTFLVSPTPSRRPRTTQQTGVDAQMRHQVSMAGASRVLGLPVKTVQALANDGWLPTVNGARVTRGARLDLLSFVKHLENLSRLAEGDNAIPLRRLEPVFNLFAAQESDVVEAILSGSLPVWLDDQGGTFADRIRITPTDLEECLRLRLRLRADTPSNKLTIAEVRNMLRLSGPEIRKLCAEGALKGTDDQQQFLVSDVLALMERYWILSCWVAKNGGSAKDIRNALRAEKLRPIAGTPVYRRTNQLEEVVRGLEKPGGVA